MKVFLRYLTVFGVLVIASHQLIEPSYAKEKNRLQKITALPFIKCDAVEIGEGEREGYVTVRCVCIDANGLENHLEGQMPVPRDDDGKEAEYTQEDLDNWCSESPAK